MDVSREFLMSGPLKRGAYLEIPDRVGKENIAWEILKPLYGLSTSRKDWCETIRGVLDEAREENIHG